MAKRLGRPPERIETVMRQLESDWVEGRTPGFRLPPELKLADQYKVSRPTIRSVLAQLERKKVLVRKPSSGCFVGHFPRVSTSIFLQKELGVSFGHAYGALTDTFQVGVLDGVLKEMMRAEMNLSLGSVDWRWLQGQTPAVYFSPPHILGVFLLGTHQSHIMEPLKSMGKPLIAVDFDATPDHCDSFCLDDYGAGEILAKRVHRLGHTRVAYVIESPEKPVENKDPAWTMRATGFFDAWKQWRAPAPTTLPHDNRGELEPVLIGMEALLKGPESLRPTAIIVPSNDAHIALQALLSVMRLRIPRDLALFAYGHADGGSPVTGIHFNAIDLGRRACEHMLNMISNQSPRSHKRKKILVKGYYHAGKTHGRPGGE